jgi:hypothetical protein
MPPTPPAKTGKRTARTASGERRQLLVYLDQEMVKRLKKAAIDLDLSASDVVGEAVEDWLGRFDKKKT